MPASVSRCLRDGHGPAPAAVLLSHGRHWMSRGSQRGPAHLPGSISRARWRQTARQRPASKRPHRDHPEIQFGRQWQNTPLGVALERVVGHLDRVDPSRAHDLLELVERTGRVMRGPEKPNPARPHAPLPTTQAARASGRDCAPAPSRLAHQRTPAGPGTGLALGHRTRPDLRRYQSVTPTVSQRPAQHSLRPPIHRRGIKHTRAALPHRIDRRRLHRPRRPNRHRRSARSQAR